MPTIPSCRHRHGCPLPTDPQSIPPGTSTLYSDNLYAHFPSDPPIISTPSSAMVPPNPSYMLAPDPLILPQEIYEGPLNDSSSYHVAPPTARSIYSLSNWYMDRPQSNFGGTDRLSGQGRDPFALPLSYHDSWIPQDIPSSPEDDHSNDLLSSSEGHHRPLSWSNKPPPKGHTSDPKMSSMSHGESKRNYPDYHIYQSSWNPLDSHGSADESRPSTLSETIARDRSSSSPTVFSGLESGR